MKPIRSKTSLLKSSMTLITISDIHLNYIILWTIPKTISTASSKKESAPSLTPQLSQKMVAPWLVCHNRNKKLRACQRYSERNIKPFSTILKTTPIPKVEFLLLRNKALYKRSNRWEVIVWSIWPSQNGFRRKKIASSWVPLWMSPNIESATQWWERKVQF